MGVTIYTTGVGTQLSAAEIELLQDAVHTYGHATLLVESAAERDTCCRALADVGMCIGIEVATPAAWIASLWELFGDGRAVVSAVERELLMAGVLTSEEGAAIGLGSGPGTVRMLASIARSCLPYALACDDASRLSAAERRVLKVLSLYEERLQGAGRIEAAAAAGELARGFADGLPAGVRFTAVRGVPDLPENLLGILDVLSGDGEIAFMLNERQAPMARDLKSRFRCREQVLEGTSRSMPPLAFAEVPGPTARDTSYARIACELAAVSDAAPAPGTPSLVLAAPDPLGTFRALVPRLAAQGFAAAVSATLPFSATRAGQALVALSDLLDRLNGEEPGAWLPAPELPDWVRSPFSGIGPGAVHTAIALDTRLRKSRRLDKDGVLSIMESLQSRAQAAERTSSEQQDRPARTIVVKSVADALDAHRYARALQLMRTAAEEASAAAFGVEGLAAQQSELAALQAALDFLETARALGVPAEAAFGLLPDLRVRIALGCDVDMPSVPLVRVCTLADLAGVATASVPAVLIADASAASYPLSQSDTVQTVLEKKLGCEGISLAPLAHQLDLFARASQAARHRAALAYVANDAQAGEVFPVQAFTLLKSAVAVGSSGTFALSALPGEDAIFSNLDPAGGIGAAFDESPRRAEHVLDDGVLSFLMPAQRSVGGRAVTRTLSASQIENYLSCPYRWFVSNRVPTRKLDVGFTAIEQGNFAHDVMQRFHERLGEQGLGRVTPQNVDACLEQIDAAFEEMRRDHERGKYTHGRYAESERPRPIRSPLVATDELERNRIDAMLPAFRDVVRHEGSMLSIFIPERFEYSFDKEGVTYAGRPLGGRIDRIDVAPDAGSGERFVVIDYKNRSTVSDYSVDDPSLDFGEGDELAPGWLPGREKDKAPKVQTLIYASAYQELTHGSAQGAVYFGLRGPQVAGAVSDALTECEPPAFPEDKVSPFPGKKGRGKKAQEGDMRFPDLLECVECAIKDELDQLEGGAIAPRPASDSCAFCPLTMCEKRR